MVSSPRRTKIAFLCPWDAADPNAMSGYAASMRDALIRLGHDLVDIFPLADRAPRYTPSRIAARVRGMYYNSDRQVERLQAMAERARKAIERSAGIECVFSPSSLPVSYLRCDAPIYFSTDQTFADLLDGYVKNASAAYRQEGMAQEQAAFDRAAGVIYPSEWARRSALRHFRVGPEKLHVVPWGANIPRVPDRDAVTMALDARLASDTLRLCFVAREWERKGGSDVLETVRDLDSKGVRVHLTIIGVEPKGTEGLPVEVIPSLDKGDPADFERWLSVMNRSHLLFVPSRAEAYGQVFCEAAAYAMPSITRSVGGIPTIVEDGVTGYCLDEASVASQFSETIASLWRAPERLAEMSLRARSRFEQTLNWDAFARSTSAILAG